MSNTDLSEITLGGGCFWCVEAPLKLLEGIKSVTSGYMGGKIKNPTYKEVCSGLTGHAEVVKVLFDPEVISLENVLEVFWTIHDPTTPNRQGNDIGSQYRSVIFYHSDKQKILAEEFKSKLEASEIFDQPIVTEIKPAEKFYPAENYHQDYFANNPSQPYCTFVVKPKVEKVKKVFAERLAL